MFQLYERHLVDIHYCNDMMITNDFKNNPALLAEKVLAEIPKQVTEYMAAFEIRPNPKVVEDDNFVYEESNLEQ